MTSARLRGTAVTGLLLVGCAGGADPGPEPAPARPPALSTASASVPATLYSDEQAERGRAVFRSICSECHYSSEMRGTQFQFEWERRTVGDLLRTIVRTMPDDAPGTLPEREYVDVVAYILRLNGFTPGPAELPSDGAALEASMKAPSP